LLLGFHSILKTTNITKKYEINTIPTYKKSGGRMPPLSVLACGWQDYCLITTNLLVYLAFGAFIIIMYYLLLNLN
jgi:hypothetical protein